MFAQLARRAARPAATAAAAARRQFADAAPAAGLMKLNFNLPQERLYDSVNVKSVIVPGATGEYEVTADHVPIVAEMKAGMLTINHEDGEEEKYFVAGGFSLTHEGSATVREILCVGYFNVFGLTHFLINTITIFAFFLYQIDATTTIKINTKKQDIVCPEAVKLDDIDGAAVTKNFEAAKAKAASAEAGSIEAAEAMIEVETNRYMGNALGMAMA